MITAFSSTACQFNAVGTDWTVSPYNCTFWMGASSGFYCIQTRDGFPWGWYGNTWKEGVAITAVPLESGQEFAGWYTCDRDYNQHPTINECNTLVTRDATLSFSQHDILLHGSGDGLKLAVAKWYRTGDPTVTFDANAEYGYVEPEHARVVERRCLAGDAVTLPSARRYPQSSWMFAGWYTLEGERVGDAGEYYVPAGDITLYAHWHTITQHDMDIRQTPAWVTSATWSYEDYGEDIRAASGNDPGAIGMLRWRIVLPVEPKTYFESIHFGIWGDNGYIGIYPSSTLPWGEIEVCGPPPPQTMEGEFEVPYRWGDYDDVQRLAGMTVAFAYVFRQSRALLYCADRWTTPLAHNSAGNLLFGHKAYTPAEAAAPT